MKLLIASFIILLLMPAVACADFPNESQLENSGTYFYINNMTNISVNASIGDSTFFDSLLSWDHNESQYSNLARMAGSPLTYWVSLVGYWAYVALIVITLVFVHGKLKSIEITGIIMMLMSLLVIIPSATDILIVPSSVLVLLYTFTGLGLGAMLYGLFSGSD